MKKRILLGGTAVIAMLTIALVYHIYIARPHINEKTVGMARLDIQQDLKDDDAAKISNWLMQHAGVSNVMCNTAAETVVFSFYPAVVNADVLTEQLQATFHLKAKRFAPTASDLKKSCPIL